MAVNYPNDKKWISSKLLIHPGAPVSVLYKEDATSFDEVKKYWFIGDAFQKLYTSLSEWS